MLPLISLFCGPGGMDDGFKSAGFDIVLAADVDRASIETYRANHPHTRAEVMDLLVENIEYEIAETWSNITNERPLGIVGGPPCQTFSVSSTYNALQKALDPRNQLPECYCRILSLLNTKFGLDFFVLENVPGLKNKKNSHKFERFKELFQLAGFNISVADLDAANFGVAQHRKRIFLVGLNAKKYPSMFFRFPDKHMPHKTVREVIGDLPEPDFFNRSVRKCRSNVHPNHWTMNTVSKKWDEKLSLFCRSGRSFRALKWDELSPTIAFGHREVNPHPDLRRRLSVFEAMLLQGFSPEYVLHGTLSDQFRMVSEVVSPPVATEIAKEIIKQLGY